MLNFSNTSTIYVSQKSGKDYYSGFAPEPNEFGEGPLGSIESALLKVYQLRVSGHAQPLTVSLVDDEYYLSKPISLETASLLKRYNDNNAISDIMFEPFGNKRCRIIGGKRIQGFKKDTFNGHECFSAYIPEAQSGEMRFTDLYVDGKRAKLTRYPKEGTLQCIDTENNEGELFTHSKWFIAKREDLDGLSNIEDAIISYYHYWIDEHSPVESYDRETGKLTMAYKSRFLISNKYDENCAANLEYYIENIPELFENPGEWYLNNSTGILYYIPENESQTPENITVYAPTVSSLVDIKGNPDEKPSNIRFRGIDFICSKGDYASVSGINENPNDNNEQFGGDAQSVFDAPGALNLYFARDCSFEDCGFLNLGIHGVSVDKGCEGIRIENCRFYDMGAGGVRIFGGTFEEDEIYRTHHNIIRNCDISYCGRRYAAGCGILACHTYCNEISENTISHLDYSGISVGWIWGYQNTVTHDNIIRKNHIHHIGMGNLSDMGGIYLLGRQRGTIVSENIIHDVICKHYGGWGIYTDEGSSFVTVERNIVYNCSSNCYHQHYGSYNVIKNNIFAYSGEELIRCSVPEMHPCIMLERNILVTSGTPIFSTNSEHNGINPGVSSHSNILFDTKRPEPCVFIVEGREIFIKDAQGLGFEIGSIIENPEIDKDFKPSDNSPAYKLGFKKIM